MAEYFLYVTMAAACILLLASCLYCCGKRYRVQGTDDSLEIFKKQCRLAIDNLYTETEEVLEHEVMEAEEKKEEKEAEKTAAELPSEDYFKFSGKAQTDDELNLPREANGYLEAEGEFAVVRPYNPGSKL